MKIQHTPGPWVSEKQVHRDENGDGLAVIAVIPEIERSGFKTPTRGIVAWVHCGTGACETEDEAISTARLIAAAPDLLEACKLQQVAIDMLFATLIARSPLGPGGAFYPSESGLPWEALLAGRAAIAKAEET